MGLQPSASGPVDSPFKTVQLDFTASLPPSYMGRVSRGVHELLNSQLLKYDQRVRGVLLGYSDVELTETVGHTCFETPDILFQARTEALVFCVDKGTRLRGVVSQVTAGHVALLCCGAFQVTITRDNIPDVLEYNKEQAAWVPKADAVGDFPTLSAGSAVRFVVEDVQGSGTQWSIEAALLLGDVDATNGVAKEEQTSSSSVKKSKKKKNKRPAVVVETPTASGKKRKKAESKNTDADNRDDDMQQEEVGEMNGNSGEMSAKQLKQARREARKQKTAANNLKKKAKKNKNK